MAFNFFGRGKDAASTTSQYFKDTEQTSRPAAFLLALVSFFVAFAVVFGLIIGGRWAWDRLRGDDNAKITSSEQTTQASPSSTPAATVASTTPTPSSTPVATPTPTPKATTTPTPSVTPKSSATATPAVVATNSDLPSTGAGQTTLIMVFLLSALVGGVLYRRKLKTNV